MKDGSLTLTVLIDIYSLPSSYSCLQTTLNPRRACAARVTVVGSVCVYVCVCLLLYISLLECLLPPLYIRLMLTAENAHAHYIRPRTYYVDMLAISLTCIYRTPRVCTLVLFIHPSSHHTLCHMYHCSTQVLSYVICGSSCRVAPHHQYKL